MVYVIVKERQEQLKDISDACDKAALEEARLKLERDNNKSKMEVLTDQLKTVHMILVYNVLYIILYLCTYLIFQY